MITDHDDKGDTWKEDVVSLTLADDAIWICIFFRAFVIASIIITLCTRSWLSEFIAVFFIEEIKCKIDHESNPPQIDVIVFLSTDEAYRCCSLSEDNTQQPLPGVLISEPAPLLLPRRRLFLVVLSAGYLLSRDLEQAVDPTGSWLWRKLGGVSRDQRYS